MTKFVSIMKQVVKTKELTKNTGKGHSPLLKVQIINDSAETIIQLHQRRHFKEEINLLDQK